MSYSEVIFSFLFIFSDRSSAFPMPCHIKPFMHKVSSLGLPLWLYWNQLLILITILPASASAKETANYPQQPLHFSALWVKSHPSFRLMVGYMNAESSLSFILWNAAESRARCKSEGEHTLLRGSHQLCSGLSSEADKGGVTTDKNRRCTQLMKENKSWNPSNSWLSLPPLSFFHGLTETFISSFARVFEAFSEQWFLFTFATLEITGTQCLVCFYFL